MKIDEREISNELKEALSNLTDVIVKERRIVFPMKDYHFDDSLIRNKIVTT